MKNDLINHVKIIVHSSISTLEIRKATDREKEEYLFKIRNDFTHNTYSSGPIRGSNKTNDIDWNFRETLLKGTEELWISTHIDFEQKLKETILIGLVSVIKA